MNVLLISPGYPGEMPHFTRGLAEAGANVIGIGDGPVSGLPELAREHLAHYEQVPNLWDEAAVVALVRDLDAKVRIDQIECLWEPGMILAARIREALGRPGMTVDETIPFRDKEVMKHRLDEAGIRTPRHARAFTTDDVRRAVDAIGYPIIIKPIDGAGSADTYRVNDAGELESVLPLLRSVPEVSVEEFVEAEEFTFDTICADGRILFHNICWYRPRPLIARTVEWISPQTAILRNPDEAHLRPGREMGVRVLDALGFRTGFTHMEWYLKADGEAVFGEIGGRPPGARTVDGMNYVCEFDFYRAWAEAVLHGRFSQPYERRYNVIVMYKRAHGEGRISRIEGLESILHRFGPHIVAYELLPIGARRRNWKATLVSDAAIVIRHPDLATTCQIADQIGTDLQIYAS